MSFASLHCISLHWNWRFFHVNETKVPTDHDIPFWRTFEVHFQGVFKDFSLFSQTSIVTKWSTMDFSNQTYRDHLILSSPEKWWGRGRFWYVFLTFLDDLLYYGYNTGSNNCPWKGVWGSKSCDSGGYTSLLLCHNKSRDCPFWNWLIHWNT